MKIYKCVFLERVPSTEFSELFLCYQPKIILMQKRQIWGWYLLLPFRAIVFLLIVPAHLLLMHFGMLEGGTVKNIE